jgi:hypothetical protein
MRRWWRVSKGESVCDNALIRNNEFGFVKWSLPTSQSSKHAPAGFSESRGARSKMSAFGGSKAEVTRADGGSGS